MFTRVKNLAPRRRAPLLFLLCAAASGAGAPARAAGFRIFQSTAVLERPLAKAPPQEFTLGDSGALALVSGRADDGDFPLELRFPVPPVFDPEPGEGRSPVLRLAPRPPRTLLIGVASVGAILGSAYNAFSESPNYSFHFTNEGYFGRNTYVGGGDKASHFVSYYGVSRLLTGVYESLDASPEQSYRLASGVSVLAGLATEIGDGTNKYGFSYEDFLLDTVGAASAYLIARYDLNDIIGFRAGLVPAPDEQPPQFYNPGIGKDYTKEIYTADFKLAGLARRLDRRFGPARFLLVSLTYGVKGYPYSIPELRERQVGLEVGLNLAEVARAVGVSENGWLGKMTLIVLDIIRFPYTAVGVRYDINHRRWRGPDTGNTFSYP